MIMGGEKEGCFCCVNSSERCCHVKIHISTFQQLFTSAIELENVLNEKALHFLPFISFVSNS